MKWKLLMMGGDEYLKTKNKDTTAQDGELQLL